MNKSELRRILLADPFSQHPDVQQALAEDTELHQFALILQQQQQQLDDALQIAIPPMLAERLLQIPQQQNRFKRWLTPVALAASLALVSVVSVQLYQLSYASDLGGHALAHVHHEEDFLRRNASAQPLSEVNVKLADFDASLQDWSDDIIYARYCVFQGVRSLHLAVKTATGYATVFVVPKDAELAYSSQFADAQYQGLALTKPKATIVVVSSNAADLTTLQQKLSEKLIFSA